MNLKCHSRHGQMGPEGTQFPYPSFGGGGVGEVENLTWFLGALLNFLLHSEHFEYTKVGGGVPFSIHHLCIPSCGDMRQASNSQHGWQRPVGQLSPHWQNSCSPLA